MSERKSIGKALIAILLLWQIAAVAHLSLEAHSLCLLHHVVEHSDCSSQQHHRANDNPFSDPSHHDCFVLMALATCTATVAVQAPELDPAVLFLSSIIEQEHQSVVANHRERFRLAPSLSPPLGVSAV